jgi:serine/threonine protein kinase
MATSTGAAVLPTRPRGELCSGAVKELSVIARAAGETDASTPSGPSSTSLSDEACAFLQRRIASFGLVSAIIGGLFLTYRVCTALYESWAYGISGAGTSIAFLAGLVAAFLVQWLSCRGRLWSLPTIRVIEAACLIASSTLAALMAVEIPYAYRPDYIAVMPLGFILMLRAVFVPGTARRSIVVGAIVGVPLVVILYFMHFRGHSAVQNALPLPERAQSPAAWALRWTIFDSIWWLAFNIIAATTARVVYGLREQVRDARKFGQYTLVEKLGEGGMGVVYRATHAMLRRPTAVKLLPGQHFDDQELARFEREVQLTSVLTHPNTVRIFDYGRTSDGVFYYAMELLEGANLAEVMAIGGVMPPARVIHVLEQLSGALAEAHGIGLIHRDIKPSNIILTEQGGVPDVVKVVDFGLVKEMSQATSGQEPTARAITEANSIAGTPLYMAPEAITEPSKIDGRTDLYALGAVGYFLLTGQDVFTGANSLVILGHHLHTPPVPPSQRLGAPVPPDLEQLILACLDKDPSRRPAGARALQSALRDLREASAWTEDDARKWWRVNGERLRATRVRGSLGSEKTVTVDHRGRDVRAHLG